ncbi:hypothetical protein LIA77_04314 [Sarocladium implicatum]|nr:hypothetical protein LIA77_04314 [Sarocladium implicatum]
MEARLLAELHHKLGLLDRKLRDQRLDLLADFNAFYRYHLREADPFVASAVRSSLQSSLSDYPDLRPQLPQLDSDLSRELPTTTSAATAFQPSSPPAASDPRTSTTGRDHESDFQGLFIPSYLPLLDSRPPVPASPRYPSHPASPTTTSTSVPHTANTTNHQHQAESEPSPAGLDRPGKMAAQDDQDDASLTPDVQHAKRPSHARTSTDETTSSVVSDRSDKTRRSALRRSSSASKTPQSPRRVRFEFMGAEVLPTASPQGSEMPTPRPLSPRLSGGKSESVLSDDDDDYEPPPRKISSSDALRALSRKPLEGTVWTVVNPDSDDASSDQTNSRPMTPNSPARSQTQESKEPARPPTVPIPQASPRGTRLGSVHEESETATNDDEDEDEDDSSSDEEFLAMAKPKSFQNKKAMHPAGPPSPLKSTVDEPPSQVSPTKTGATGSVQKEESVRAEEGESLDQEEDPFHFEMSGLSAPPRPRSQPRPITTRDEDETDDQEPPSDVSLSTYATSPAVSISRPNLPPGPPTPTSAKFQVGSVGSYKGRPIVMPVVRDPEVHAQAESLGDFNTFVGGLDGSSGMDEGDMNSFRASVMTGGFSGTPRSLTERFMMEEAQAERKRRGEAS